MSYSIFENTMVDMPWTDVEKAIKDRAVVLLPTGVIEQHGPHMGLGVDTYLAYKACMLTRDALEKRNIKAIIAPPCYWGINNATGAFTGSFTIRKSTMKALINDIFASLKSWGVEHVFNINWHDDFEHCSTLLDAIKEARVETGIRAYSGISDMLAKRLPLSGKESHVLIYKTPIGEGAPPKYLDIHAGAGETGVMLQYFPGHVDKQLASKLKATALSMEEFALWRQGWGDAKRLTPLGYLGNPSCYNIEEGRLYMEGLAKAAAEQIEACLRPGSNK